MDMARKRSNTPVVMSLARRAPPYMVTAVTPMTRVPGRRLVR